MHYSISFKTSKFNVSTEKENPINPICGVSLLDWLREILKNQVNISKPEPEDWGWYSYLKYKDRIYLIGASVDCNKYQSNKSELEWIFQIDKQRSFIEKLLGKAKMNKNDPCLLFFKSFFESNPEFKDIYIE